MHTHVVSKTYRPSSVTSVTGAFLVVKGGGAMSTIVQTNNVFLPEEMEQSIEALLSKLFRRHSRLQKVTASLARDENKWYKVLITAHIPGKQCVIVTKKPHLYSAVVDCVKRVNRVLRKDKEKRIHRTRK